MMKKAAVPPPTINIAIPIIIHIALLFVLDFSVPVVLAVDELLFSRTELVIPVLDESVPETSLELLKLTIDEAPEVSFEDAAVDAVDTALAVLELVVVDATFDDTETDEVFP